MTDKDVRAGSIPLTVVAAKKPRHWIVRAIGVCFNDSQPARLRKAVERYVGTLDPEIEWTTHRYEGWPHYVVYGDGDLPRIGWPDGVYRFDHQGEDVYRAPAIRLGGLSGDDAASPDIPIGSDSHT